MKPEIKAQWVKDLRDPQRKQATGHLRNIWGGQCCLDVLCEQAVKAGVIGEPYLDHDLGDVYVYSWSVPGNSLPYTQHETLPDPVWQWAELEDGNPVVSFDNPRFVPDPEAPYDAYDADGNSNVGCDSLAEINDSWHLDFHEIANIIEEAL